MIPVGDRGPQLRSEVAVDQTDCLALKVRYRLDTAALARDHGVEAPCCYSTNTALIGGAFSLSR